MLGDGLIAEEVFTVQATAQLLQKAKDVVYAVHHGQAEQVLLSIKCSWRGKSIRPPEIPVGMKLRAFCALSLLERETLKAAEQHLNAAFLQYLISFLLRSLA